MRPAARRRTAVLPADGPGATRGTLAVAVSHLLSLDAPTIGARGCQLLPPPCRLTVTPPWPTAAQRTGPRRPPAGKIDALNRSCYAHFQSGGRTCRPELTGTRARGDRAAGTRLGTLGRRAHLGCRRGSGRWLSNPLSARRP